MEPEQNRSPILTFRDALGLAMELADEYAFVNAAAVIDNDGQVVDMVVAEGIGRTIQPVIGWLTGSSGLRAQSAGAGSTDGRPEQRQSHEVLLMSVRPFEMDVIREEDLRLYRCARWAVAAAGTDLIDWIETDGDLFRSYAYLTCPAEAWADDPPTDRLSDGRLL